jgi:hypothetical protein
MKFALTNAPFMLALVLGALLLPMLNIYNVSRRGLGIVRYCIGETCSALVKPFSAFPVWRVALGLALLAMYLASSHSGDAHSTPILFGIVAGAPPDLAKTLAAYLGRNQGPELFTVVPHTAGAAQSVVVPRNLSINRPLESIVLRYRARVTVTVANMGAVAAEAPSTFINKITINGTFKGTALTPIKLSGATAYAWGRLFGARGNSTFINGIRQAEPSIPYGQVLTNIGNVGVYDIDVFYYIPTWPLVSFSSRAWESVPYFWQPEDWADSIQVQLDFGDATSLGTAGGATVALTAFGSLVGVPECRIFTQYCILGDFRPNTHFQTAAIIRNESQITAGMGAITANAQIQQLQKQKTTNVVFKTGTNLAGTNASVQVFAALTDLMLDRTLITVDNKNIRFNQDNITNKETFGNKFGTVLPQGYNGFTFIDSQTPRTAYRADDPNVVGGGSTFLLTTDVLTAGATQAVNVIQEMIFANRADPSWLGTR